MKSKTPQLLSAGCVILLCGALFVHQQAAPVENSATGMILASQEFLNALTEDQRAQATFAYDSEERLNWHFIPRERNGIALRELEGEALKKAQVLISSGLSELGYTQALNVMSLEEVLYLLEGGDREYRRERRDPKKYYLSVFGTPAETGLWGWRVEGHHLSLNYSIQDGQVVATTPEFFGANPGTIESGVGRTLRVLGPEEDLARQVFKSFNDEQRSVAWIDETAPNEIRDPGETHPSRDDPVGLPASRMSGNQRKLLAALLTEYLQNMPADVEAERRSRMNAAGIDAIHFAWWGGTELNEPHYYRVQGPTFLIEYNNVQNNANHVHSVWRDMEGDLNVPLK
jgi:hypothetical protein